VARVSDLGDYLAGLDEPVRSTLEHVRDVALAEAPGAGEGTSYGLAALMYRGKPLLGFLAAKDHMSVYPFSGRAVDGVRDRLPALKQSKGTVRFTGQDPLADDVVRDLVRLRIAEIDSSPR
jgi:uncharacterized protein YdhG (YjbR/CyaY superfamily)